MRQTIGICIGLLSWVPVVIGLGLVLRWVQVYGQDALKGDAEALFWLVFSLVCLVVTLVLTLLLRKLGSTITKSSPQESD